MQEERKTDPRIIGGANCEHPFYFELRLVKVVNRRYGHVAVIRCMNCNKEFEIPFLSNDYASE